jgi:hypothetical protein
MTGMSEIPIRRPFLWRKQYYPKEMTKITYKGHEFDFDAVVNLMGFNDRLVGTPRPALPPDDCMMAAIVAPVGARNIAMMRACLVSGRATAFRDKATERAGPSWRACHFPFAF